MRSISSLSLIPIVNILKYTDISTYLIRELLILIKTYFTQQNSERKDQTYQVLCPNIDQSQTNVQRKVILQKPHKLKFNFAGACLETSDDRAYIMGAQKILTDDPSRSLANQARGPARQAQKAGRSSGLAGLPSSLAGWIVQ